MYTGRENRLKLAIFSTFGPPWPWLWIQSNGILSRITHWPVYILHTKRGWNWKNFLWTDAQTLRPVFTRATLC